MDFVVGLSVPDPQQHVHIIVAESCRELSKISKIPGSDPDLRPMKNFKKSRNFFSKLVREPFLCIPYALWKLGDPSKHVFHTASDS